MRDAPEGEHKRGGFGGINRLPAEDRLGVALCWLSSAATYALIASMWHISESAVYQYVQEVVRLIASKLYPKYVRWATFQEQYTTAHFFEEWAGLRGVCGVVDGTHIAIPTPDKEKYITEAYFNRKGYHSILAMVVCDFNMRFIHVQHGWPGSCSDSTSFSETELFRLCKHG